MAQNDERLRINKVGLEFRDHKSFPVCRDGRWTLYEKSHGILYFCPHCGTEFYGEWCYTDTYKDSLYPCRINEKELKEHDDAQRAEYERCEAEIEAVRNMKTCPVCQGELRKDYGYCLELGFFGKGHRNGPLYTYLKQYWGYTRDATYGGKYHEERVDSERSRKWQELADYNGKSYSHGSEHFIKNKNFPLDLGYKHMKAERRQEIDKEIRELLQKKTLIFDQPVFELLPAEKLDTIRNTPTALKNYVHNLIKLENNIYSLSKRLEQLYILRRDNERAVCRERYMSAVVRTIRKEIADAEEIYSKCSAELKRVKDMRPVGVVVRFPVEPTAPQLEKPGLFNKKKVQAENDAKTRQYEAEMEQYRKAVAACEQEKARQEAENKAALARRVSDAEEQAKSAKAVLDALNATAPQRLEAAAGAPSPAKAITQITEKEISEADELLKSLYEGRNKLYSYDIVFGKYRNVVALSSFYEYLMSGRCETLEGANGAYNIYEGEIRANQVIAQLSAVLDSLEQIKNNQYMIYNELQGIHSSLDRLNSTMECASASIRNIESNTDSMNDYVAHISQNSDVIAHNTAATAYYSKMNAELTNALGYMVALT